MEVRLHRNQLGSHRRGGIRQQQLSDHRDSSGSSDDHLEGCSSAGMGRSRSRRRDGRNVGRCKITSSAVAPDLVLDVSWGVIQATRVQSLSSRIVEEVTSTLQRAGVPSPEAYISVPLLRLASLGNGGQSPQNCWSQLVTDFGLNKANNLIHTFSDNVADSYVPPHKFFPY